MNDLEVSEIDDNWAVEFLLWKLIICNDRNLVSKVEKVLKGSLDSIPSASASVKIEIMGRKVCLMCKGKTLLGVVNKLLKTKTFKWWIRHKFPVLRKPLSISF